MVKQDWYPIEDERTLGTTGSERGVILQDEEYAQEARITLEQCQHPPFAITCSIYGWMFHTTFASSRDEALETCKAMKKRLEEIRQLIPFRDDVDLEEKNRGVSKALEAFVREF